MQWARCRYGIYNPGCRVQIRCRWSARRVKNAASVCGIVRRRDSALPMLYPNHSNARRAIIRVRKWWIRVRVSVKVMLC